MAENGGFINTTDGIDSCIEMIVDLRGVEAGDGSGRKEVAEQIGAGFGQFIEDQRAASRLREDGKQAGAGRGFQHTVARRDRSRSQCGKAEWNRRRELLKRLAFLGTARVRRQQRDDFRQHGKPCSRRGGFAEKRLSVFAQEQDCRDLARLIGGFPVPGAGGVGGAERGFHGAAQEGGVDPLAAFEMGKQKIGGGENGGGRGERKRRRPDAAATGDRMFMGRNLKESGNGQARATLSLDRPDSSRPGRPLPLKCWT